MPELRTEPGNAESRIGDRITIAVSAAANKDLELIFPETPEDAGEFSFISSKSFRRGFAGRSREGREYVFSIYKSGTHVIPPIKVLYRAKNETEWKSVLSAQVPVEVASLLDGSSDDIKDIRGVFSRSSRILYFLITFFSFAALVSALVWLAIKGKKALSAGAKPKPAHEVAYEKLAELKAMRLAEKGFIKEYYIRLSEIVRYYLEDRFSFRAPEMTTEEFLDSLRGSPKLKTEHKQLLRDFLSQCDMVKFAKYGPTPLEALDSFSSAERLVDQTRPEEEGEDQ